MDPRTGSQAKSKINNRLISEELVGSCHRGRTGDTLLAKTGKEIYLIGSFGFVLCRGTRFCT
jgi:hypothetical protein